MSLHPTNNRHGLPRRSPLAALRTLAAAAGIGLAANLAAAADPLPPPQPAADAPQVSDVVLARSALAALDADPELRGVTLVVSVAGRVAVIGGPVANARQARRAGEVVKAVPGIAEVRNTCFVSPGPDPLLRAVADRLTSSLPPRPVMFDLPGVLTGAVAAAPPAPFPGPRVAAPNAAAPGTVVSLKPSADVGILGAPVGPAAGSPAAVNRVDVLAAVEAVRKTEARFDRLTVEWRDGALVIGGSAPLASDAWDFARMLQAVPGVARVAVGNVVGK
jgi:hypothetical protein